MAKRKRRNKQPPEMIGGVGGSGVYTQKIIKHLKRVNAISGHRPSTVFEDWLILVEASLEMLPVHLKAISETGQFASDSPETSEKFAQIRARYRYHGDDKVPVVWTEFGTAFALLFEGTAPGLGAAKIRGGYMGPDILGHVYMTYANSDPSWSAQYFTPWNVALLMAQMSIGDGEQQVHDRLNVT